jgi:hypothetical protein
VPAVFAGSKQREDGFAIEKEDKRDPLLFNSAKPSEGFLPSLAQKQGTLFLVVFLSYNYPFQIP